VTLPAHHDGARGYINPWPSEARTGRHILRWGIERIGQSLPPNPRPSDLPVATSNVAQPRTPAGELRITWVGHATFLVQIDGWNVLTDPQWSQRAFPVQWAGPRRFVPPGLPFDALPPIDVVLISHDHYDHLDSTTVRRLADRHPDALWVSPLGYERWFRRRGVQRLVSLDWWHTVHHTRGHERLDIVALPAQHWTSRTPFDRQRRLWASFAIRSGREIAVYFAGDSGYFNLYPEIGRRIGRQHAVLMPIGAYEPRWFMAPAHMNPEEAVQAYRELNSDGCFVAMHWGTWRLTDEDPLDPPRRAAAAWRNAGLPEHRLWIPQHGETRIIHR
jgi:N-acyl-phosphatidylethanolamine-hydrolysing phospholipase D